MKKIIGATALLTLILVLALFTAAAAIELSADVIMKSKRGAISSRMYLKADKFRADSSIQPGYHIIRQDRNVIWVVLPESRIYMEIRFSQERKAFTQEKVPGEVGRKLLGSESIDGHATQKYEVIYEEDGRLQTIYQWIAVDINFPVKVAAADGSWSNEYKNIKLDPIPDNLFEIPPGFEKMSIPEMQVNFNPLPVFTSKNIF